MAIFIHLEESTEDRVWKGELYTMNLPPLSSYTCDLRAFTPGPFQLFIFAVVFSTYHLCAQMNGLSCSTIL